MSNDQAKVADNDSTVQALEGLLKMGSAGIMNNPNNNEGGGTTHVSSTVMTPDQFQAQQAASAPSPSVTNLTMPSSQAIQTAALSMLLNPIQSSATWSTSFADVPSQLNICSHPTPTTSKAPAYILHPPTTGTNAAATLQLGLLTSAVATKPSSNALPTTPSLQPIAPKKEDEADNTTIRRAEVDAALKSKPQRGRKRDNLNGLERLELTRTRNREHAKSTRIRKKARYEELLANEQKFFRILKKQETHSAMNRNFVKFMEARTAFLNLKLKEYAAKSWEFSLETTSENEKDTPVSNNLPEEVGSILRSVIETPSSFKFDIHPQDIKIAIEDEALLRLQHFDTDIVNQVKSKVQNTATITLNFVVEDEIVMNERNTGYVNFKLLLTAQDHKVKTISSGILQAEFATDSCKIKSVYHIATSNYFDCVGTDSPASLGTGTAFPSVVSLDHHLNAPSENENENS